MHGDTQRHFCSNDATERDFSALVISGLSVADVYNIKPHQIASSSSLAIKNLFWSYFTTIMVN